MNKSRNIEKCDLYTLAFARIKESIAGKFPVEAIALEESIISDRLRSLLLAAVPVLMKRKACDVGSLISYAQLYIAPREDKLLSDLYDWIKKRNNAIHGIVSTRNGGGATFSASRFVSNAMAVAKKGESLAHQLSDWTRKEKRVLERRRPNPTNQCERDETSR